LLPERRLELGLQQQVLVRRLASQLPS